MKTELTQKATSISHLRVKMLNRERNQYQSVVALTETTRYLPSHI